MCLKKDDDLVSKWKVAPVITQQTIQMHIRRKIKIFYFNMFSISGKLNVTVRHN